MTKTKYVAANMLPFVTANAESKLALGVHAHAYVHWLTDCMTTFLQTFYHTYTRNLNLPSVASNEDVSNAAFVTSKPKCSNALDRFHSSQETYQLLRSATPDDVLPDVPRGRKDNSWYLVDNSHNAQRKQGNRKTASGTTAAYGTQRTLRLHL